MSSLSSRSEKFLTVGFYWAGWLFSYAIRYALGIVAPILMKLYHISPRTMGYVLSGWNWSYTGGMLVMGPLVDRFGAWIVTGAGSALWGLATVALPLASLPASLFSIRLLFGLGHSMLIAATAASVSREFGSKERATSHRLCIFRQSSRIGGRRNLRSLHPGALRLAGRVLLDGRRQLIAERGLVFLLSRPAESAPGHYNPIRLFARVPGWTFFVTDPPGASLSASWDISMLWAYL